jgi:hypothetical protein
MAAAAKSIPYAAERGHRIGNILLISRAILSPVPQEFNIAMVNGGLKANCEGTIY